MLHAVGLPIPSRVEVRERFTPMHSDDMAARIDEALVEGSLDPEVRAIAETVTSGIDWRDQTRATITLLRWVQSRVRYAEDPAGADLVQYASYTLGRRSGDCVAQTILLGSLLRARGINALALYVDPDGGGIAHVLLRVEPSDGGEIVVDPIDYARPLGYVPRGRLFLSRGDGRAVPVEDSSMLAVTARRTRSVRGYGNLFYRRGYGMVRPTSGIRPISGEDDSAATGTAEEEVEDTGPSYVGLGIGGAMAAIAAGILKDSAGEQTIDPKTGQVVYTMGGRQAPPVAPPAASTVFGLPLFATLGIAALILFAILQAKKRRR